MAFIRALRRIRKRRAGSDGCLWPAPGRSSRLMPVPGNCAVLPAQSWLLRNRTIRLPGCAQGRSIYERMALEMTALNIKSAFLTQPVEVAELRSQFQGAMGLEASLPQLLLRFGHAAVMPPSLRRPVEQVLMRA